MALIDTWHVTYSCVHRLSSLIKSKFHEGKEFFFFFFAPAAESPTSGTRPGTEKMLNNCLLNVVELGLRTGCEPSLYHCQILCDLGLVVCFL